MTFTPVPAIAGGRNHPSEAFAFCSGGMCFLRRILCMDDSYWTNYRRRFVQIYVI